MSSPSPSSRWPSNGSSGFLRYYFSSFWSSPLVVVSLLGGCWFAYSWAWSQSFFWLSAVFVWSYVSGTPLVPHSSSPPSHACRRPSGWFVRLVCPSPFMSLLFACCLFPLAVRARLALVALFPLPVCFPCPPCPLPPHVRPPTVASCRALDLPRSSFPPRLPPSGLPVPCPSFFAPCSPFLSAFVLLVPSIIAAYVLLPCVSSLLFLLVDARP